MSLQRRGAAMTSSTGEPVFQRQECFIHSPSFTCNKHPSKAVTEDAEGGVQLRQRCWSASSEWKKRRRQYTFTQMNNTSCVCANTQIDSAKTHPPSPEYPMTEVPPTVCILPLDMLTKRIKLLQHSIREGHRHR